MKKTIISISLFVFLALAGSVIASAPCRTLGESVTVHQECCDGYVPTSDGNGGMLCWTTDTVGPQGPAGPQGEQGPQGIQGDQGSAGSTGATGPEGSAGPQGLAGDTGSQGEQGLQGNTGSQGPGGPSGSSSSGPSGFGELVGYLNEIRDWWNGKITTVSDTASSLYSTLNQVFVNRNDFKNLENRVTALEKTEEATNNTAFCQGKIQTMIEYNLTSVDCKNIDNSITTYSIINGFVVGITPG